MNEKRTELIYSIATAAAAVFMAFKDVLSPNTVAWILFGLAVVYMILRTALKVAKVWAASTPGLEDDAKVAAYTALLDRLGVPQAPVIPAPPVKQPVAQEPLPAAPPAPSAPPAA